MRSLNGWILCGLLGAAQLAGADAVTDWNQITVDAVTVGRPGPIGIVDIALVQVAVHDAVQAIEKRFEPYHFELDRAYGRRSAAVAAAAHDVLVGMYPAQAATLDPIYFSYLADHGLTGDSGLAVGQQAAARILPLRRVNPNPLPPPFVGGTDVGRRRPTPSFLGNPPLPAPFSPMAVPWMGSFDPFTLTSPTRFRAGAAAGADERALHEGLQRGQSLRLSREHSAQRRADGSRLLLQREHTGAVEQRAAGNRDAIPAPNGRLRAAAWRWRIMATADALISSWDSKMHYVFWRPITAIVEADHDGNPHTIADASWQPLINNPNYPDYTSGANNVAGAMTRTLELFFEHQPRDVRCYDCRSASRAQDANVSPLLGRRRRHGRGTHASRHPLSVRGCRGAHAGTTGSGLDCQSLPAAAAA